jgi:metallo-beta-lactamase family protein
VNCKTSIRRFDSDPRLLLVPTGPTLQFLGAAGTVTGSMHLLETGGRRILLDAGLFQGLKPLRLRNWAGRLAEPRRVDAVVLSHAHLDHSGYLPLLVRQGFRGPIHCTPATADLLGVMLRDSAHLLEEEAERANRYGYSKHRPALPLYTVADAEAALALLDSRRFGKPYDVVSGVTALFRRAGHILGAATIELVTAGAVPRRLVYSGDLGRWDRPLLRDPEPVLKADVLLLESTYGDRLHPGNGEAELARIVRDAARRGGVILVPAFTVGRVQELLWLLEHLEETGRIPALPVHLDSPMAIEVNEIYARHADELDPGARLPTGKRVHLARTPEESKRLNDITGPAIIVSASGMATGGRVLHHLSLRLPDPRTTVLLVGFQAAGTRGRSLQDGAREVRMLGRDVPVRATVESIDALSAHADREETLRWLGGFTRPPRQTYLVHGEPAAAAALAQAIEARYRWAVRAAADGETVEL